MKGKKVTLQSRRVYSEEFRRAQVQAYESGKLSVGEIGKLFGIADTVIYRWIYRYSTYNKKKIRVVEMAESNTQKIKELHDRIKELERIVGIKQLNIEYLEKMIELAQSELDIDIKKNFDNLPSDGSRKTGGKSSVK
jgi:transposase-like protein